ncbi:hypothetical protein IE81DRAFT_369308 [Ceraceosorus guamensis]|uniref:Uncharacterized protein n=1 Tax=Ceraceosorus guamensis TaxID=1522189 RepID=A0A316VNM1_9BASI|nr:hypothetical protein IE81DRAFT_369308 [Ceraceosorus guamensis]PWN39166.1 hypothetical protein IE81DRAFT_369308 [Ceraceosorus guamensis]
MSTSSSVKPLQAHAAATPQPGQSELRSSLSSHSQHPFRLEVRDVTPVSISLLWSLRPPPISAAFSNSRSRPLAGGSNSNSAALQNSMADAGPRAGNVINTANLASTSSTTTAVTTSTITTSPTMRRRTGTTRLRLRTSSPSTAARLASAQASQPQDGVDDADNWPDDGATAVDVDSDRGDADDAPSGAKPEQPRASTRPQGRARKRRPANHSDQRAAGSDSETSETAGHGDGTSANTLPSSLANNTEEAKMGRVFDSGVSVSVNGVPWTHVVLADRGSEEAVIVVYGLLPNRVYSIDLAVGGKDEFKFAGPQIQAPEPAATEGQKSSVEDSVQAFVVPSQSAPAPASPDTAAQSSALPWSRGAPASTSTPPLLSSEDGSESASHAALLADIAASSNLREALNAELRKARKESQRAEGALRSEIDALKKGLQKQTDTDHRSRQKVLALQEGIRQSTLQAKEMEQEAESVNSGHEEAYERERQANERYEQVKVEVEKRESEDKAALLKVQEDMRNHQSKLSAINDAVENRERERKHLKDERCSNLELQIEKLKEEIERIRSAPLEFVRSLDADASQSQSSTGSAMLVATQVPGKGSTGSAGTPGGQFNPSGGARVAPLGGLINMASTLGKRAPQGRSSSGPNVYHPASRRGAFVGGGRPSGSTGPDRVGSHFGSNNHPSSDSMTRHFVSGSGLMPRELSEAASYVQTHQQAPFSSSTTLNPNKPEFVPSGSSVSPVLAMPSGAFPLSANSDNTSPLNQPGSAAGASLPHFGGVNNKINLGPSDSLYPHRLGSNLSNAPSPLGGNSPNLPFNVPHHPPQATPQSGSPFSSSLVANTSSAGYLGPAAVEEPQRRKSFGPLDYDDFGPAAHSQSSNPGQIGSSATNAGVWNGLPHLTGLQAAASATNSSLTPSGAAPGSNHASPWNNTVHLPDTGTSSIRGPSYPAADIWGLSNSSTSSPLRSRAALMGVGQPPASGALALNRTNASNSGTRQVSGNAGPGSMGSEPVSPVSPRAFPFSSNIKPSGDNISPRHLGSFGPLQQHQPYSGGPIVGQTSALGTHLNSPVFPSNAGAFNESPTFGNYANTSDIWSTPHVPRSPVKRGSGTRGNEGAVLKEGYANAGAARASASAGVDADLGALGDAEQQSEAADSSTVGNGSHMESQAAHSFAKVAADGARRDASG